MSAMAHQGTYMMLTGTYERRLLAYLFIPALWSCAAPIPQAKFDGLDRASTLPGIVMIVADQGFTNYGFHTEVKSRERRCYSESRYSCQYEDVVRKVDIDIGSSSMQLFKDGLGKLFEGGLAAGDRDEPDVVEIIPSVSASGSYEKKDDWWLYVLWNNWTLTCNTNVRYGVLLRNWRGDSEEVLTDWIVGQQEIHSATAVVKEFFLFPLRLANLFNGRDAIVTACFSKAFAQAESKAFSSLAAKLYASKILHKAK
jgi:hypothetical protein